MRFLLRYLFVVAAIIAIAETVSVRAQDWPRFRGPNGSGVSLEKHELPAKIGPDENVAWQVDVPHGVSSPVVFDDRVYLTGVRDKSTLIVFALNATDGSKVWEAEVPVIKIEKTDKKPKGRLATPSCTTDGRFVVSSFGSSGLVCHTVSGREVWRRQMGPFDNTRGATSSPFIFEGMVILLEDHNTDSFLEAFDLESGRTVWRADRTIFNRSHGTPMVWTQAEKSYVIATGSGLVTGYDIKTGLAEWFVQGTSSVANITPVCDGPGRLFVASANPGARREGQLKFDALVKRDDANSNGKLEHDELRKGFVHEIFGSYDADKSGTLSNSEYESMQTFMRTCKNGMLAISAGGQGHNRTESQTVWHVRKGIPRTSSPIYYDGTLFMMNDGGVFVTLDAETGKIVKMARTPAKGKFFSSPVLGDGKVFAISDRGEVVVLSAKPEWELLSNSELDELSYPSPAISNGRVFVRTESKLYCFRK
jgi:outer membrane protein assembly factor BamB